MKNQVLFLFAVALVAGGCMGGDTATRTSQTYSTYGSADEPFPVLNAYGNWIDVGPYGRVWQPAVMSDWRPYAYGQWVWTDRGWMWDSDEPFGWVVYHYGYWTQMEALGWVWVPGNEWSPARVNWYSGNDYIGWAPMAPPQAAYPQAYQPGYENYWVVVPAPQFTRLNVGAYRTVAPPPQPPPAAPRGRATERPPDIITIQGATHQLIAPRKTEQEDVRVGRRTVARVRVAQDDRPSVPTPVSVSPASPDVSHPPSQSGTLPGAARVVQRPTSPAVVPPPPVQQRTPSPVRVTPAPAPNTVAPAPAPNRIAPVPNPGRTVVQERPQEKKEEHREAQPQARPEAKPIPKPEVKKDAR